MKKILLGCAAAVTLCACQMSGIPAIAAPSGNSAAHVPPPADYSEKLYTTADGCTYGRAQMPGYLPTWHLIVNSSRLGLPDPHPGCPAQIGEYYQTSR
jgi:hypothetical protein